MIHLSRKQDATLREIKKTDVTIYNSVNTIRTIAIVTVIILLALIFALALTGLAKGCETEASGPRDDKGLPHGEWQITLCDGTVTTGTIHHGRWHGPVTVRRPDGRVDIGVYDSGRKKRLLDLRQSRWRQPLGRLSRWPAGRRMGTPRQKRRGARPRMLERRPRGRQRPLSPMNCKWPASDLRLDIE